MSWQVNYTIEYANGKIIDTMFSEDPEMGNPIYQISGKTEIDAIEDTIDYLTELFQENCLKVNRTDMMLTVSEPSDNFWYCRYSGFHATKMYELLNADGKEYMSTSPGKLGGHRRLKIYGRLDCPSANRYIQKGQYVQYRVFFKDEATAIAAGYRPCAVCMKEEYKLWKQSQEKEVNK